MAAKASGQTALAIISDPEEMVAAIQGNLVPEIEDPEVVAQEIVDRILASESAEDVLGGGEALHAGDALNRPFTLHGMRVLRSRFDKGPGVFLVLDAEFGDDGERAAITCSSRNVMAQAVQLFRLDALPRKVQIVQSENPTANGYHVLRLKSA